MYLFCVNSANDLELADNFFFFDSDNFDVLWYVILVNNIHKDNGAGGVKAWSIIIVSGGDGNELSRTLVLRLSECTF